VLVRSQPPFSIKYDMQVHMLQAIIGCNQQASMQASYAAVAHLQ